MLGQPEENNLYENTTTPLLTVRMNCLTKREDFCLNDWEPELNESKPQETDGLSGAFNLLAEEFL